MAYELKLMEGLRDEIHTAIVFELVGDPRSQGHDYIHEFLCRYKFKRFFSLPSVAG